jgi:hypothetical protein
MIKVDIAHRMHQDVGISEEKGGRAAGLDS